MKICDFVTSELRLIVSEGNLTDDEAFLLSLRARDIPLEECAEIMNLSISSIKHRSQKLNNKIIKVMNL